MESNNNYVQRGNLSDMGIIMDAIFKTYPLAQENGSEEIPEIIRERVTTKINDLVAEVPDAAFQKLGDAVMAVATGYTVTPEMYYQYPNYALTVEIKKTEYPEITIVRNIKLRLSLLVNYFTVFHEELTIHRVLDYDEQIRPAHSSVISSRSCFVDGDSQLFNAIVKATGSIFEGYRFISHYPLFINAINDRTPYGFFEDLPGRKYPAYNFLFGNDYDVFPYYLVP